MVSSVWFALLFSSLSGKRGGFHVISGGVLRQIAVKKYAFIAQCIEDGTVGKHSGISVTRACYLLGISTSGFYDWRKSDKTHRYGVVHTDAFIVSTIKAFIEGRCKGYTPGLMVCYRHLRQQGVSVSVPRLRNLMRNAGIYHRFNIARID